MKPMPLSCSSPARRLCTNSTVNPRLIYAVSLRRPKKPSGQRMRGRMYDRIRERLWSKSTKEKGHETCPKLSQRDQAVVSTRRARVLGVSSHLTRGGGGVQTDSDYAGRSHQAEPRGLSLPGPPVRRARADLSQRAGRCIGPAPLHVWVGHCAARGTTAPE